MTGTAILYVVQHQKDDGGAWRNMREFEELHTARSWERTLRDMPGRVGSVRTVERRTTTAEEPLPPA